MGNNTHVGGCSGGVGRTNRVVVKQRVGLNCTPPIHFQPDKIYGRVAPATLLLQAALFVADSISRCKALRGRLSSSQQTPHASAGRLPHHRGRAPHCHGHPVVADRLFSLQVRSLIGFPRSQARSPSSRALSSLQALPIVTGALLSSQALPIIVNTFPRCERTLHRRGLSS